MRANGRYGIAAIYASFSAITGNTVQGNATYDLHDSNPPCPVLRYGYRYGDSNTWTANVFGTRSTACID